MQSATERTKRCKKCQESKGKELFTKDSRARDGLSTYCKACHNLANRELYARQGNYAKQKYSASKRLYYQIPRGKYVAYINDVKCDYAPKLRY